MLVRRGYFAVALSFGVDSYISVSFMSPVVMDDVKISKFDRFRFDFLEKISILNNDRFFPPT